MTEGGFELGLSDPKAVQVPKGRGIEQYQGHGGAWACLRVGTAGDCAWACAPSLGRSLGVGSCLSDHLYLRDGAWVVGLLTFHSSCLVPGLWPVSQASLLFLTLLFCKMGLAKESSAGCCGSRCPFYSYLPADDPVLTPPCSLPRYFVKKILRLREGKCLVLSHTAYE